MNQEISIEQWKEKLLDVIGIYYDYNCYVNSLENVLEEHDETLEQYDFNVWMGKSHGTIKSKAEEMLRLTLNIFKDIQENAQDELCYLLQDILSLDDQSIMLILGIAPNKAYNYYEIKPLMEEWYCSEKCGRVKAQESLLKYLKNAL